MEKLPIGIDQLELTLPRSTETRPRRKREQDEARNRHSVCNRMSVQTDRGARLIEVSFVADRAYLANALECA